jgi:acyl-coenzyme A thioesterase PaaI-like protein
VRGVAYRAHVTTNEEGTDPWQTRPLSTAGGGAPFGRLLEALRRLQDAVVAATPPEEDVVSAVEDLERVAAGLERWGVPERDRWAGRRLDLPGRGHPGLLPFVIDEEAEGLVRGRVVFRQVHLGGNGAAHGGTVPLLFDEVLGRMVNRYEPPPPTRTAYLTVNYRAITPVGPELLVEATIDRQEGRKRWASGRLYDGDRLVAEAEGLFIKLRPGMP